MAKKPEPTLRARAMAYLARREYSRAELGDKLLPHAAADEVAAVLDEMAQRNWLSDERAAEQLLSQRRSRFGAQRIAQELRQKGIAESLIAGAMPQLKENELETARAVWQKKFGEQPQDVREKARQVRFLQSRGFALDVIFKLLNETVE